MKVKQETQWEEFTPADDDFEWVRWGETPEISGKVVEVTFGDNDNEEDNGYLLLETDEGLFRTGLGYWDLGRRIVGLDPKKGDQVRIVNEGIFHKPGFKRPMRQFRVYIRRQ